MKILFVVERPTQFEAPFFRFAAADPEHEFEVLFTRPAPGGSVHDPELGRTVSWGIDLTSGYPWSAPVTDRPLNPSIPFSPSRGEGDAARPARSAPGDSGTVEMGPWRRALWVARQVRRRRPDLVIVNGYTQREYLAAAIAARLAGVPAALRIDSVLFPGEDRPKLSRRLAMSIPLASLFHLFLTTGSLGRRYLEGCGVPEARIGLFPYAVDVEHFRRGAALAPGERRRLRSELGVPERARVVLALAKFSPREAPWDLLRAFCSLPGEDLRLVLGGDGPERAALEAYAERHEADRSGPGTSRTGRVLFPGYVPYPELPSLYGAVDLFVHPAAEERWGVSVEEALATGLPVIASDRVGAGHDLIRPGENGSLYHAGDSHDLAQVLTQALGQVLSQVLDQALKPAPGPSSPGPLGRSAAVEEVNRAILARWDYRAAWEEILRAAATVQRPPISPPREAG